MDLAARLDRGICRYRGKPYYINGVGRGDRQGIRDANGEVIKLGVKDLLLWELADTGRLAHVIKADDPLLDISTPPLGFYQVNATTVGYISRRPLRQFKQTLDADMVSIAPLNGKHNGKIVFSMYCKGYYDAVIGEFPSYEDTLKHFAKSEISVEKALSSDVAFKYFPQLHIAHVFYKNEEVGWVSMATPRVIVVPSTEKGWVVSRYLNMFNDWKVE